MPAKQEHQYLYKVHRNSSQGRFGVLEPVQLGWVEGVRRSSSRFRLRLVYPHFDVDDLLGVGFLSSLIPDTLHIYANFCPPVSVPLAKTCEGEQESNAMFASSIIPGKKVQMIF